MARKFNLRQFQTDLSRRMHIAAQTQSESSRLGFQTAASNWLVSLDDIEEVAPLTEIVHVPGTHTWFRGMSNLRGNLYAISDLGHFLTGAPTPESASNRLLIVHHKFGVNAGLIIQRALGLRQPGQFRPAKTSENWICASGALSDDKGTIWHELDLATLMNNPAFLSVEI